MNSESRHGKSQFKPLIWIAVLMACAHIALAGTSQYSSFNSNVDPDYAGVPQSTIYAVTILESINNSNIADQDQEPSFAIRRDDPSADNSPSPGGEDRAEGNPITAEVRGSNQAFPDRGAGRRLPVFESSCPAYQPGYMNMLPVDQHPLDLFRGRSIDWVNFSFSGQVTIQIRLLGRNNTHINGPVNVFPSASGVKPGVDGNVITFTLTRPGQYSVEIGADGYKNGLLIFANPPENDQPNPASGNYFLLTNTTPSEIDSIPASYSGVYFRNGVHDIGVYHVRSHIKNIYFEPGAWVYGALIMDGNSDVKIFGRGVLSGARLNYRESHMVEAIRSDRIHLEGIVIADKKYFAVRLLGTNNTVKWVKIVGGWTYNTDGIAAFAGSHVAHCFIWANDDSLKPYRDNLTISDCVVWQLNNGAVIQLGWGNARAANVTISNVDILHAEWNNNAANRGILSCIGDKFAKGGMLGFDRSFLIENVVTETPVPFIFNIRPNPASPDQIHGMIFKNWNITMDMNRGYPNYIECADANNKFDGFVFDDFTLNGTKLTDSNWIQTGHFTITNLVAPTFK